MVIDRGEVRKRRKKPSKKFHDSFGHIYGPFSMLFFGHGFLNQSQAAICLQPQHTLLADDPRLLRSPGRPAFTTNLFAAQFPAIYQMSDELLLLALIRVARTVALQKTDFAFAEWLSYTVGARDAVPIH